MKKFLLILISILSSVCLSSCGIPIFGESKPLSIPLIINSKLSNEAEHVINDSEKSMNMQNVILVIEYSVNPGDPYIKHYDCYQLKNGSVRKEDVCYVFENEEDALKYVEDTGSKESYSLDGNIFSFSRNWFIGYSYNSMIDIAKGSYTKDESILGYTLLKE